MNHIIDKCAYVIAEALKVNHTLQGINLSWNKIGDQAIHAFEKMLEFNSSLIHVKFETNMKFIYDLLERNLMRLKSVQKLLCVRLFAKRKNDFDWNICSCTLYPLFITLKLVDYSM